MHHFQHLVVITIAASLLGGCPETVSCDEGEQYSPVTRRCAEADGGTEVVDSGIDAAMDAGPCQGRCPLDFCDPGRDTCLDCRVSEGNADCEDTPATSVCDEGTCVPCGIDEDCRGGALIGTPECTADGCVACTVENEAEVCGEFTCNPSTFQCTDVRPGTIGTCEVCVADSQCASTHRCAPVRYQGIERGGRCLPLAPCARGYASPITGRASLSGEEGLTFCGVNEDLTTCEAVLAIEDSCAGSDTCPDPGSLCRTISAVPFVCTYPCTGDLQCPAERECPAGADRFCQ